MRVLARIGSTLAVLALAAPAAVLAQAPGVASTSTPMPNLAPIPAQEAASAPMMTAPHKHKWSLFRGRRHCVECQRAEAMKRHGVNVPMPPALPGAVVAHGGTCADCGKSVMVVKEFDKKGMAAGMAHASDLAPAPPGVAMVGDAMPGGAEPEAIGMFNPALSAPPMPGAVTGPRDPAIMQSSVASDPITPHAHNKPRIILHTLNLDGFRAERNEREDRKKAAHAAISYNPNAGNVTSLPANMVFGK